MTATGELERDVDGVEPASSDDAVERCEESPRSSIAFGLSGSDVFVLVATVVLACGFVPVFYSWLWTSRMIVLLVAIPAGVHSLWTLVRAGDRAARWAAAVLGWSLISASASGAFVMSFKGFVGQDASVVVYVGVVALWALARRMTDRGRSLIVPVVITGCGINLAVGLAQVCLGIESSSLSLMFDRATGLTGNPVFFGALVAAGAALVATRASASTVFDPTWHSATAMLSIGVAISGSRVALLALLLVVAVQGARSRRLGSMVSLAAIALGTGIGTLISNAFGDRRDAIDRLSESGTNGRFANWVAGAEATVERPIFGWGLGRFRRSVQGRFSLDQIVEVQSVDFVDPHNIVVGIAVALGIPGLVLVAGFVRSAARLTDRAVVPWCAVIALTLLLQPAALVTLSLAMLMLGVTRDDETPPGGDATMRRSRSGLATIALAVGIVPAAALAIGEYQMYVATTNVDAAAARSAERWYGGDAVAANVTAGLYGITAFADPEAEREMFAALQRSVELDPTRARWLVSLAAAELRAGRFDDAEATARRSIERQPYDRGVWRLMWDIGERSGDDELRREAAAVLCSHGDADACALIGEQPPSIPSDQRTG